MFVPYVNEIGAHETNGNNIPLGFSLEFYNKTDLGLSFSDNIKSKTGI